MTLKKKDLDAFFEIFHNKRNFLNIRSSQNMKPPWGKDVHLRHHNLYYEPKSGGFLQPVMKQPVMKSLISLWVDNHPWFLKSWGEFLTRTNQTFIAYLTHPTICLPFLNWGAHLLSGILGDISYNALLYLHHTKRGQRGLCSSWSEVTGSIQHPPENYSWQSNLTVESHEASTANVHLREIQRIEKYVERYHRKVVWDTLQNSSSVLFTK